MGKIYVVRGAIAKCSYGTMKCKLMIPTSHGAYTAGKPNLNINDYEENKTISHFGFCKNKVDGDSREEGYDSEGNFVRRCEAQITGAWKGGQDNDLIEGVPALSDDCVTYCKYGGEITIEKHSQTP